MNGAIHCKNAVEMDFDKEMQIATWNCQTVKLNKLDNGSYVGRRYRFLNKQQHDGPGKDGKDIGNLVEYGTILILEVV